MGDQQSGGQEQSDAAGNRVELVAVVNSLNRRELLEASLSSLTAALRQLPFGAAIVVFDAGSTDGSVDWLREFQSSCATPEVFIVVPSASEDTSFSAGVNAGCHHALAKFPELRWLFLFETDNFIASGEPIALAARLLDSHPQVGAAGFTVTRRSGKPAGFGCSFPSVAQFLIGQQLTSVLRLDRPRMIAKPPFEGYSWGRCDVVYTSPLLIKRDVWEETKGLDAATFPFAECDLDWCWRANRSGWEMAVIDLKGVVHDNVDQASSWSSTRVLSFHRGRFRLLQRHLHTPAILLKLGLLTRHALEFAALVLASPALSRPGGSLRKRWVLITTVLHGYQE
jgi:GT2 family glycosyltransferase